MSKLILFQVVGLSLSVALTIFAVDGAMARVITGAELEQTAEGSTQSQQAPKQSEVIEPKRSVNLTNQDLNALKSEDLCYIAGNEAAFAQTQPERYILAAQFYKQAAELNNPKAQAKLGELFEEGKGVKKDPREAFKWYQKAFDTYKMRSEGNDAPSLCILGELYEQGHGTDKNPTEAIRCYKKAFEIWDPSSPDRSSAAQKVGHLYKDLRDYESALEWYEKALSSIQGLPIICLGNTDFIAHAIDELGTAYLQEKPPQYNKAAKCFQRAIDFGDSWAAVQLRTMYESTDPQKAIEWDKKRADQGHTESLLSLAGKYASGRGAAKDDAEAAKWYQMAAESGDKNAYMKLASIYEKGEGVQKNITQAVKWYERAMQTGNTDAMLKLASMYSTGDEIEKEPVTAQQYYKLAVEELKKAANTLPSSLACLTMDISPLTAAERLAEMYERGEGVPKDHNEAIHWHQVEVENLKHLVDTAPLPFVAALNARKLADIYNSDKLGHKYPKEADIWYRKTLSFLEKAVESDDSGLWCLQLGEMYFEGRGTAPNEERAVEYYRKAADKGISEAQYRLSWCYMHGRGVKKDVNQAMSLLSELGKLNDPAMDYAIALLYEGKTGVIPKNARNAAQWYQKAIEDLQHLPPEDQGDPKEMAATIKKFRTKIASLGDNGTKQQLSATTKTDHRK